MPVAVAREQRRHRTHDQKLVAVRLAPGGADKHTHCALLDERGFGRTSPGPDGHVHQLLECDVELAAGHRHDLSGQRCTRVHDQRAQHV